ncbi:MAG TPA: leucyl/phenylalanyl-tRNA--protein transferase [Candidatus Eisenbacteria bacterium]|nr:leucyl/phenylalanyl-tRNA--protein transferase [Candidatus Eisenbacteria bacterium]
MPIVPPPSRWAFPPAEEAPSIGILGAGADLEPGTILAAYRAGIFPWPDQSGRLLWWSPDPRAIIPLSGFHASTSLRRLRRRGRYAVTRDTACADVIRGCATSHGPTWITPEMLAAYVRLHEMGWAHSVEVWRQGELVGGVYGVAMGGLFAAESMFHLARDASKVALAELVEHLRTRGFQLLDVQLATPHLRSLGAIEIPRAEYLALVEEARDLRVSW